MIPSQQTGPVLIHVRYRAKKGHEGALLELVKRHWPIVRRLGLATETPVRIWKLTDREGGVSFVELFEWRDAEAPQIAHQTPEIMAVWEPMANVMEGIEISQAEQIE